MNNVNISREQYHDDTAQELATSLLEDIREYFRNSGKGEAVICSTAVDRLYTEIANRGAAAYTMQIQHRPDRMGVATVILYDARGSWRLVRVHTFKVVVRRTVPDAT